MDKRDNRTRLKEFVLIFGLSLVVFGVLLHFALPWFSLPDMAAAFISLLVNYPSITAVVIGAPVFVYTVAYIRDYYAP